MNISLTCTGISSTGERLNPSWSRKAPTMPATTKSITTCGVRTPRRSLAPPKVDRILRVYTSWAASECSPAAQLSPCAPLPNQSQQALGSPGQSTALPKPCRHLSSDTATDTDVCFDRGWRRMWVTCRHETLAPDLTAALLDLN